MVSVENVSTCVPAVARDTAQGGIVAGPTVSIVVPVLDGERFIRESLESILGQSYAPAEIIVRDDGSTEMGESV